MKNNFYQIQENKQLLTEGLSTIKNLVGSTLGPTGQTIILSDDGINHVTKDGVTVAEFIHFDNPFLESINNIIKETARKTGKTVGDGTTTSIILACDLMLRLLKLEDNTYDLDKLDEDLNIVISNLKTVTVRLDLFNDNILTILKSIVNISSNNDEEITDTIVKVIKQIGPDGLIDVTLANGEITSYEIQDGILLESPAHIHTTEVIQNPFVVLVSSTIEHVHQLKSCMQLANELYTTTKAPFIVIAKEFSTDIQNIVTINNRNNKFKMYLVESDGFANNMLTIMDDMALLLDCVVLSTDSTSPFGLQNITEMQLARIKSAVITPQQTVLQSNYFLHEKAIKIKEDIISKIVELKSSGDEFTGELRGLEKRLTKFSKSATIKVGGITEMEKIERKDRFDDAVMALSSAVNYGVVPGGGSALYIAAKNLNINSHIKAICYLPVSLLGHKFLPDILRLYENKKVMNFITEETGDPFELGILDPADVQIKAINQALVIAKSILGSYAVITRENEV